VPDDKKRGCGRVSYFGCKRRAMIERTMAIEDVSGTASPGMGKRFF